MKLENKTIVITGASSGIGRALAFQLAQAGNQLVLVARRLALLQDLHATLAPHPAGHWLEVCDVADRQQVEACCARILARNLPVRVLILNAGTGGGFDARRMDLSVMHQQMDVNFWGVVYMLHGLLPCLLNAGEGQVAVTGSLAAYRGMPGSAIYSASKAAVSRLVESLRIDLYHSGVHFSLVSPGFVKTAMTDKNQYRMPFLMSAEKAAAIIIRGMEKNKTEIHFPYRLSLLSKASQFLPDRLYARLMHPRNRKSRTDEKS